MTLRNWRGQYTMKVDHGSVWIVGGVLGGGMGRASANPKVPKILQSKGISAQGLHLQQQCNVLLIQGVFVSLTANNPLSGKLQCCVK